MSSGSPDRGWYAVALGPDKEPVDSLTSNIGHCLWTGIVDDDRAEEVAKALLSPPMWTGWGIRTLAADERGFDPDELPLRIGVAARQRALRGGARPVRVHGGVDDGDQRAARRLGSVERPAARVLLRSRPGRRGDADPDADVVLAAGVVVGVAVAAAAAPARARARRRRGWSVSPMSGAVEHIWVRGIDCCDRLYDVRGGDSEGVVRVR